MSCAAELPICIPIGQLFSEEILWLDEAGDPIVLAGWSGTAQLRKTRSATSPLLATFTVTIDAENTLTVSLPAAVTETLSPGTYRWQLDVSEDATPTNVVRAIEGKAIVEAGVNY